MLSAFLLSISETLKFGVRLLVALRGNTLFVLPLRLLLFILIWLSLLILTAAHWLGFLIDELVFRAYRRIEVSRPVFVVGLPRSGTTWLQRVLAQDETFTSLTLWECLVAPSISERYLWRGIGFLLRPITWILNFLPFNPLAAFDKIHKLRLNEPEEDCLLLLPVQACFLLVFLCPSADAYWRLSRFDQAIPERRRQTVLQFYKRCLQKHLYYHGRDSEQPLRILSKNPSFTSLIDSLQHNFPQANIVACIRNPKQCVPSQLSAIEAGLRLTCPVTLRQQFRDSLCDILHYYYQVICDRQLDSRLSVVDYTDITEQLQQCVIKLYQRWDLQPSDPFLERLRQLDRQGRRYRSQHDYSLASYQLTEQSLQRYFIHYWRIQSTLITSKA